MKSTEARKLLLSKEKICIIVSGSMGMDADSFYSSLVLAVILQNDYMKKVILIGSYPLRDIYKDFEYSTLYKQQDTFKLDYSRYDLVVITDASSSDLVVDKSKYENFTFPSEVKTLVIDHHSSNDSWGTYNFIDEDASSACELVYSLFPKEIKNDIFLAQMIMSAILSDTGRFRYATQAQTFKITSELVNAGVNINKLNMKSEYPVETEDTLDLFSKWIKRVQLSPRKLFSYCYIPFEELVILNKNKKSRLLGQLINGFSRVMEGSQLGVVFIEDKKDVIRVELRGNINENLDLSLFAKKQGGGGHFHAAGFSIRGQLNDVLKEVLPKVDEYVQGCI